MSIRHLSNGSRGEVFVLDDDRSVRDVLSQVLTTAGYEVILFADGLGILAAAKIRTPTCIILDVYLPGESGLDVLDRLREENYHGPILMISGQANIATAVSAIRLGAADFIEKPFRASETVARVNKAIEAKAAAQAEIAQEASPRGHFQGRELLSKRELDVLKLVVNGATSKEAGRNLGISPRTVEDHRTSIIKKLGVKRGADLIRVVVGAVRGSL